MIASLQLLPDRRPKATRAAHLLGSGMNPGVVNVLIRPAIEALSRRAAQPTEVIEADLVSILFTEIDSTEEVGGTDREVMATTWNPRHFVEELLEPHAMYSANGRPSRLAHRPDQRRYRARCGADIIEGFVVPHDEVTTMGAKYPGCEVAYVYRPNPAADAALSAHPTRGIADWALRRLYPPHAGEMCGGNRIGVLLTTRSFGELWFGYDTPIDVALPFGTNATLLQVAAGVLAGWRALSSLPAGVFTTEDLDPGPYLRVVDAFLGSPGVYDDPQADSMPLIRRAVLPVDETTTSRSR